MTNFISTAAGIVPMHKLDTSRTNFTYHNRLEVPLIQIALFNFWKFQTVNNLIMKIVFFLESDSNNICFMAS